MYVRTACGYLCVSPSSVQLQPSSCSCSTFTNLTENISLTAFFFLFIYLFIGHFFYFVSMNSLIEHCAHSSFLLFATPRCCIYHHPPSVALDFTFPNPLQDKEKQSGRFSTFYFSPEMLVLS